MRTQFMTQPAKAQEPSMEEILASIRRIIADDDAAKPEPSVLPKAADSHISTMEPGSTAPELEAREGEASQPANEFPVSPKPAPSNVLELTEEMATPRSEPQGANLRKLDTPQNVPFEPVGPPPRPPTTTRAPKAAIAASSPPDKSELPLMSAAATAAVNSAFTTLAHTVLVQNARTLEDLVKEMLRPLLKSWLDDNLPTLVERLVRAEIERVSRGHPG
jgi:uncharacterized protein